MYGVGSLFRDTISDKKGSVLALGGSGGGGV